MLPAVPNGSGAASKSANAAALLFDEKPEIGQDGTARVIYQPLGTVLGLMPWNFPLWRVLRAAIPILAAGNAFLVKHADSAQGSARAVADAFDEAGLPEGIFGVLNVRRGDLPRLTGNRRIAAVTVYRRRFSGFGDCSRGRADI